LYKLVMNR